MAKPEISISLETLPDNDSFLPRYLTVQLLAILAQAANSRDTDSKSYPLKNPKFVETFKDKQLFTPLTYAIFWRENIANALQTNELSLDDLDQYNRAPLTLAIANEDFALALQLVNAGSIVMLEDKLVLEIALISMLQRDPNIMQQIIDHSAENTSWVKEYLEYLHSYIVGNPVKTKLRHHEVLNPPLRQFGQVLDTLAYFNGLPSHYGFLSPSVDILATHLQQYTSNLDSNIPYKETFNIISSAYTSTAETCRYYANLPTKKDAAQILTAKILNTVKTGDTSAVVLFGGWAGNTIAIAFVSNTLIFSNLGIGGSPDAGTKIFAINRPENITENMVDLFIRGLGNAIPPYVILDNLGSIVDAKPLFTIQQNFNPIDNCIFVNPRAVIQGMVLALTALQRNGKITAASLNALAGNATDYYVSYVNSLYKYSTSDLTRFMRNHQLLQNKRLECCALALDYINQHYQEPDALGRCIELKNALEFVGLKDFYITNIDPKARQAIQDLMIKEQEATAIKVIKQENEMVAKGSSQG